MKFACIASLTPEFREELQPLLEKHWAEIAVYKDIPLDPNWEWYAGAVAKGAIRAYTMRTDEGELVGYAAFAIGYNRHYQTLLQAGADVVFIDPAHRKHAFTVVRFLKWCDEMLKELGVQLVIHRSKAHQPALGGLVQAIGYDFVENSFMRRL